MKTPLPFRIIPCDEWGAKAPSGVLGGALRPHQTIFHHTAGHVPNLGSGETYAEACAYARAIQKQHMGQDWVDSGHNFLITRGGYILEGRHRSIKMCQAGLMVVSAHCPGHNDQPGVEHEHNGSEKMTPIQRGASVWLHAKLCTWGGIKPAESCIPHKRYFATACPGALAAALPALRKDIAAAMAPIDKDAEAWFDKYGPKKKPAWVWPMLEEHARRLSG